MKKCVWLFLLVFSLPLIAYGQTGTIQGRIVDANGSGQANARISVTDLEDNVVLQTTTGTQGEFSFAAQHGEYRVDVQIPGSTPLRRIVRVASGTSYLSITAAATETIPPRANLNAVVLNEEFVRSLSEERDEFSETVRGTNLVPGIAGTLPGVLGQTDLYVDGEPGTMPVVDQIRQVWVGNDPFTSEFRLPGLARIDFMTPVRREGLRGTAAFNFRDESMNAAEPGTGIRRPSQLRYLHGILNGPIIREKLFTSITGQRHTQESAGVSVRAITPSGAVVQPIERPVTEQTFGTRSQYEISNRHRLNVHLQYGSSVEKNIGVGGFNLPERGSTQERRAWDVGIREAAQLSPELVHELRFQIHRETTDNDPVTHGYSINVQGAFNGGGASSQSAESNTTYQLGNVVSWARPQRIIRAGIQARYVDNHSQLQPNAGTFTFFSLQDYQSGTPSFFTQTTGTTTTDVEDPGAAAFAQVEWAARPRLSLSMGLRYEFQSEIEDLNNLDPRVGFAYRLSPSVAVRGGGGIYHQLFPVEHFTTLSQRTVGSFVQILNPSYPDPFVFGTPFVTPFGPSLIQAEPDLQNPYVIYGSVSVEKRFDSGMTLSGTYDYLKGVHQIRQRNINAPLPGSQVRPFPGVGNIPQFESAGSLRVHSLSLRFRTGHFALSSLSVQATGGYTAGSSEDDNSIPANAYDLRAEWAASSPFPKHHLWSGLNLTAPWGISGALLANGRSGLPYTITVGFDQNGDGSLTDRPAGVVRNSERSPHYVNLDARVSKTFGLPIRTGMDVPPTFTISVYGRNILNATQHGIPSGVLASPLFGVASSMRTPRELELSARVAF
jgi:hypothetical protein